MFLLLNEPQLTKIENIDNIKVQLMYSKQGKRI